MSAASLGRRRPRPVADVPAVDARELARAWLVGLVAAAPLERATGVPGPAFAEGAPRLCAAVMAALGSDAALDDLEPGGGFAPLAGEAAALAGAEGGVETVAALDALRAATWDALVERLHRPPPQQVADLADRLATVIATVTTAALGAGSIAAATLAEDRGPLAPLLREPGPASDPAPPAAAPADLHPRVPPWTAAVERRLERHASDRLPFALLCLEVADLDRLVAAERDGDVARALEAAEAAVCAQLRPADVLVRERPGRYWLVAPDTDAEAARSLAHLLAAAVAGVPGHRGEPLEAAVGIATVPADGTDAAALEGHAEEGLFAARASGLRVAAPPRA